MLHRIGTWLKRTRKRLHSNERGITTLDWIGLTAAVLVFLTAIIFYFQTGGAQAIGASVGAAFNCQIARWEGYGGKCGSGGGSPPGRSGSPRDFSYTVGPSVGIPTVVGSAIEDKDKDESNFFSWLLGLFKPQRVYAPTIDDVKRAEAKLHELEEKYGIEIRDSDTRSWTKDELEWLDEALGQLPDVFWGKSSLEYITRVDVIRDDDGAVKEDWLAVYRGNVSGEQWIELSDRAFENLWGKSKTNFIGIVAHELTHSLQYFDLDTGQEIAASANPLMIDYATQFGWEPPQSDFMSATPTENYWDRWTYKGEFKDLPGYNGFRDGRSILQFWNWFEGEPTADDIYALTNPTEDMAEAVRLYVTDPDSLSEGRKKWIEENLWNTE